jgi:hypothetical protein
MYSYQLNLKIFRRQLKPEKSGSKANNWTWKVVEDNYSLWGLKYSCNRTWQLEISDGYSLWQRIAKDTRRCFKEEESEEKRGRKKEVETQAQTVLFLGLNQITKFIYRLDRPLGEGNIVWCEVQFLWLSNKDPCICGFQCQLLYMF